MHNVGILPLNIFYKMKRIFYGLIVMLFFLISCSNNSHYDNPNLLDIKVDFTVNLSLPQFNPLKFPMQPVYARGWGNGGVIIMKTGPGSYIAFDAHDPNVPSTDKDDDCAILQIDGIEAVSSCEVKNTYSLATGTAVESKSEGEDLEFPMKPYQVIEMGGDILRIKN